MGRGRGRAGPYAAPRVTPAERAERARLTTLEADPRVRDAALIADLFGLDPVLVLAEPDPLKRLVRLAAHNAVTAERVRAARRQRPTATSAPPGE